MADAVKGNPSLAFDEKNGHDFYVFNVCDLAKVVDVVILAHQIDIAEVLQTSWIIVVSVNHEDRHGY